MENSLNVFLELFEKELLENEDLRNYHRLISARSPFYNNFRKAYIEQRLEYVLKNIIKQDARILDVGCGYGTTSFLLGMMGHQVTGTTLEYYFNQIDNRLKYWSRIFDTSGVNIKYENLFHSDYSKKEFDYIITQDTIHHLEPVEDAFAIFREILKDNGKIIVSEENGNNIICNLKHFRERGFKRVIEVYDEKLKIKYKMGNENTRSITRWTKLFGRNNLTVDKNSIEFIRFLPPCFYRKRSIEEIINLEKAIGKKLRILRELFFFGINFMVTKQGQPF
jgi:2-polyprenyl-3-methyl-5-hydroxy-6-metoxy-1,4-benzoquinol methylase